jgi:hypothetical protein
VYLHFPINRWSKSVKGDRQFTRLNANLLRGTEKKIAADSR